MLAESPLAIRSILTIGSPLTIGPNHELGSELRFMGGPNSPVHGVTVNVIDVNAPAERRGVYPNWRSTPNLPIGEVKTFLIEDIDKYKDSILKGEMSAYEIANATRNIKNAEKELEVANSLVQRHPNLTYSQFREIMLQKRIAFEKAQEAYTQQATVGQSQATYGQQQQAAVGQSQAPTTEQPAFSRLPYDPTRD